MLYIICSLCTYFTSRFYRHYAAIHHIFVQYNLIFSTATFLNDDNIDGSSVIGYSALV